MVWEPLRGYVVASPSHVNLNTLEHFLDLPFPSLVHDRKAKCGPRSLPQPHPIRTLQPCCGVCRLLSRLLAIRAPRSSSRWTRAIAWTDCIYSSSDSIRTRPESGSLSTYIPSGPGQSH